MAEQIFKLIGQAVEAKPDVAKKINGIFQFKLTGPDSEWIVDLKEGKVFKGTSKANVTLTLKESDFVDLMSGKADGQQLFMGGKIKFKGNMGLLMKLTDLQKLM
eukprot:snap_masked-scaffold_27-processed-gene-2.18-mRNA-1 protein AED:0.02 eAED:0.02 QI:0/-1/0/1/-1/1/1/0/103